MRTLLIPTLLLAATALAQDPADVPTPAEPGADRASYLTSGPREMFQKGIELVDRGAIQEAKTVFTALTLAYPQLPEPHINLAVLLAAEGGEAEAAAAAEAAIRAHPVCRAAFDLEFQRQLGGYSATVLSIGEPAPAAAAPSPRRTLGPADLPRAAATVPPAAPAGDGTVRVVRAIDSCLKLRPRPDLAAEPVDCLAAGTEVRVHETAGEWRRATLADGREGWLAERFLGPGAYRVVSAAADPCLNFRARPAAEATALECLPPGTRVQVRETTGEWSRVVLSNGREGWMAAGYLVAEGGPDEGQPISRD